jgi:hypothetical protein
VAYPAREHEAAQQNQRSALPSIGSLLILNGILTALPFGSDACRSGSPAGADRANKWMTVIRSR